MSSSRTTFATAAAVVLTAALGMLCWLTGAFATAAGSVTWSSGPAMPFKAHEAGGIGAAGRVFVFGGYDIEYIQQTNKWRPRSRATAFDPATGTWTELAPLPPFANGSAPGATHIGTATDGTAAIYLAGGYPASASGTGQLFGSRTVLRYDIAADRYDALPDLPAARGAGGLALLGSELHFVGGSDTSRDTVSDHWALDLTKLSAGWTPRAALPSPRNHLAAAAVHGRLFVAGGQVGENAAAETSDRLEAYNPATDRWNAEPPLPTPLSHLSLTTNGDVLYLLGGETAFTKPGAFAYTFDPATETWGPLSALPAPRSTGVAASIGGSLFYAGGGRSNVLYRTGGATSGPTPRPTATPKPGTTPAPTATPASSTRQPIETPSSAPLAEPAAVDPRPAPPLGAAPAPAPTPTRVVAEIKPRIVSVARRSTARFATLLIDPTTPGTTATIRCTGGRSRGCPPARHTSSFQRRKDGKLTLRGALLGRALGRGAVVEVRLSAPGLIGRVERYAVGKRGRVTVTSRCLTPGATTTTRCG